jgi:hypothetical protein
LMVFPSKSKQMFNMSSPFSHTMKSLRCNQSRSCKIAHFMTEGNAFAESDDFCERSVYQQAEIAQKFTFENAEIAAICANLGLL